VRIEKAAFGRKVREWWWGRWGGAWCSPGDRCVGGSRTRLAVLRRVAGLRPVLATVVSQRRRLVLDEPQPASAPPRLGSGAAKRCHNLSAAPRRGQRARQRGPARTAAACLAAGQPDSNHVAKVRALAGALSARCSLGPAPMVLRGGRSHRDGLQEQSRFRHLALAAPEPRCPPAKRPRQPRWRQHCGQSSGGRWKALRVPHDPSVGRPRAVVVWRVRRCAVQDVGSAAAAGTLPPPTPPPSRPPRQRHTVGTERPWRNGSAATGWTSQR